MFLDSSGLSLLLPAALFGVVCLALYGVLSACMRVKARDLRHLGTAATDEPVLAALKPVLERLAYLASLMPQGQQREWIRLQLTRANLLQQWSPELVQTMKIFSSLVILITVPLLGLASGMGVPWLLTIFGAILAFFLPDVMLYMRANERQDALRKSLPFAIDLLSVSAEAGLAFQQAVRNVVDNSKRGSGTDSRERELMLEFELLLRDMQMGKMLSEALEATARRISLDEFTIFTSAILQSDRLGTPVSETLKRQSAELRSKLAAKIETKANQAPVKILFPLILFIFPVTTWVIIGPVLLKVFNS